MSVSVNMQLPKNNRYRQVGFCIVCGRVQICLLPNLVKMGHF